MDTIITAIALAAFTVAGFMFLLMKIIKLKGIAQHKAKVDIGCTVAAFFLFAGTSTLGIFVAVISGFLASVVTSIIGGFYSSTVEEESSTYMSAEKVANLTALMPRFKSERDRISRLNQ